MASSGSCNFGGLSQSFYYNIEGYYAIGGIGMRNTEQTTTPGTGSFTVSDPNIEAGQNMVTELTMTVQQAFLYWNIIVETNSQYLDTGTIQFAEDDKGDLTDVVGTLIGCCGNTNWQVDKTNTDMNLINKVYRADVTDMLSDDVTSYLTWGEHTYYVADCPYSTTTNQANGLNFPGLIATQGVVLLIIYNWVDGPSTIGYPVEKDFWKIRVFDGAALVNYNIPPVQLTHPQDCLGCPTFAFAAGDSQLAWSDMVYVNGTPITNYPLNTNQSTPQQPLATVAILGAPQIFASNVGPGMSVVQYIAQVNTNNVTIDVGNFNGVINADALCWFLYVHAAHCCNCKVSVSMTGDGQGLSTSGNSTLSLGPQYVDAIVTNDTCGCLDPVNPVLLSIDGGPFGVIPDGGQAVDFNTIIDIQLNSTQCQVCEQYGAFCAPVTTSSAQSQTLVEPSGTMG